MNPLFKLFLLVVFFSASTLHAQAAVDQLITTSAQPVVVTGAKFAQLRNDSPQNVSVIDSTTIARSTDLSQLLNEQAGIVINGAYSNPGKDKSIFLRNGANQYTIILLDGQPLLDPSSLGGAVDLRLLSLDGIERIEILRGPRSLLYGSDAVAGVINLISKKGAAGTTSARKPSLHLRAAAQNYGTFDGGFNLSTSTAKLDYQFGYGFFSTNGISEAQAPENSPVDFNKDGSRRQNLNAGISYRPNQNLSLRPTLRLASFNGDYDAGSFQDAANSYTNKLLLPSLAVDYKKEKIAIGGRYSYAKSDRVFSSAFGTSNFKGINQQTDVFGTWLPTELAYITFGAQHRAERLNTEGVEPSDQLSAATISPYLQLGMRVAEALLVEGGYRYNHHSDFGSQSNFSLAFAVQTTKTFSSRLSLSSAYQSPTLDQLRGPFGQNPNLQPQVATAVELGSSLIHPEGNYSLKA